MTVQARLKSPCDTAGALAALREFYAHSPFVRVTDSAPRIKEIVASNYAQLSAVANGQDDRRDVRRRQPEQGRGGRRRAMDESHLRSAGNRGPHRAGRRMDLRAATMNADAQSMKPQRAGVDHLAPVFAQYPVDVVSGEGVWLLTRGGERVLDLYGGHAVAALGYAHPGWTRAIAEQAKTCNFQSNAVPMDVRTRAADRLVAFAGNGFDRVFFVNSGAEANENAMKMAFRINPKRTHVAALEYSFHGRTAAAGALTWGAAQKWYALPRAPFDVSFMPRKDIDAIAKHVTENTAAVILYTSGTTGLPKGAVISHRAMIMRSLVFSSELGISHRDSFVAWAPMFHMASTDHSLCDPASRRHGRDDRWLPGRAAAGGRRTSPASAGWF